MGKRQRNIGNRTACKKRDGGCAVCGCTHSLNTHHIIHAGQGGSDSLENLITLCFQCHRAWHDGKFPPNKFIQKINKHFRRIKVDIQYQSDGYRISIIE